MSYRGSGAPMAAEEEDVWSNEFWSGPEQPGLEAGVEVVLARLKHGTRTLEDLRAFYRERASIEEDYAKRLNRLARGAIGGHETGSLKQALDRTRHETANAASAHEKLAHMMRTALEQRTKEFEGSRDAKRKQVRLCLLVLDASKAKADLGSPMWVTNNRRRQQLRRHSRTSLSRKPWWSKPGTSTRRTA